jgi:glycosyltransferase involved in cell wall biosynthesis
VTGPREQSAIPRVLAEGGGLVVVPGVDNRTRGIDATWLGGDSLTSAFAEILGASVLLTSFGAFAPGELSQGAVGMEEGHGRSIARHLPKGMRVALGDVREWRRSRRSMSVDGIELRSPRLVVQYHHRFHASGLKIAKQLGIPCVLRVEALEVREEQVWGIHRPGWGWLVESRGELPILRAADLVASVSSDVDGQVGALGIHPERRMVLPNGVDVKRFRPDLRDPHLRRRLGDGAERIVGWIGGFRPFHGLELIPKIAAHLRVRAPGTVICLVGGGPVHAGIIEACRGYEDVVRFTGPVAAGDVPRYVASFDVGLLVSQPGPFHYSPLKLPEYLASGLPVVAPQVGDIGQMLSDSEGGILVPPGDAAATASAIARLTDDERLRTTMGIAGRTWAMSHGSWTVRAHELLQALGTRGLTHL